MQFLAVAMRVLRWTVPALMFCGTTAGEPAATTPSRYLLLIVVASPDVNTGLDEPVASMDLTLLWTQRHVWMGMFLAACGAAAWLAYRLRQRSLALRIDAQLQARQQERERIARDLHDTLLQGVYALGLYVHATAQSAAEGSPLRTRLEHALARTAQLLDEGRDRVSELRTLPRLNGNLADLLNERCRQLGEVFPGPKWRVRSTGEPLSLHPVAAEDVYRIACEALLNAFRHSRARHVCVRLQYGPNHLVLTVRDDGTGVSPAALAQRGQGRCFGLAGMRERAERVGGHLQWTGCHPGTRVKLIVPTEPVGNHRGEPSRSIGGRRVSSSVSDTRTSPGRTRLG